MAEPRFPRPTGPGYYWMRRHPPSKLAGEIIIVRFYEDAFPFPDNVHVNDEFIGPLSCPWPEGEPQMKHG